MQFSIRFSKLKIPNISCQCLQIFPPVVPIYFYLTGWEPQQWQNQNVLRQKCCCGWTSNPITPWSPQAVSTKYNKLRLVWSWQRHLNCWLLLLLLLVAKFPNGNSILTLSHRFITHIETEYLQFSGNICNKHNQQIITHLSHIMKFAFCEVDFETASFFLIIQS